MAKEPAAPQSNTALLFHALQGLEAQLAKGGLIDHDSEGAWALIIGLREAARALNPGTGTDERGLMQSKRMRAFTVMEKKATELVAACLPYLKPGETPAGRIKREIEDGGRKLGLIGKYKKRAEAAEAKLALMLALHGEIEPGWILVPVPVTGIALGAPEPEEPPAEPVKEKVDYSAEYLHPRRGAK
jgi:hypothetical protein